ncbi:MAG: HAD family hydrolase [Phycisphaeraceae bacterium]
MKYRLIGIDLDGTLLDARGKVSDGNRDAVRRALEAGVMVVPCTGRGWNEAKEPLETVFGGVKWKDGSHTSAGSAGELASPGVFVTGAAVCDVRGGKSLDLAMIEPHVAMELVDALRDMPEAVLVYRDLASVGHDYLITGRGSLTPNTQWWFQRSGATVHYQREVNADDLQGTLRVGVVARRDSMEPAKERVRERLGEQVFFHSFQAVQMPDPAESMHILEVFAAGVDKWRGIEWVAQAHGITAAEIAVIGDEINDVQMLANAGCGIAMGNAIEQVRKVARYTTHENTRDGVAHAIEQLLVGRWG